MFDTAVAAVPRAAEVRSLVDEVRDLAVAGGDAARVEQLPLLEELKRATSAAQARVTAALVASQRAAQLAAGVPAERASRGVAEQVALARGESPHLGGRFVGTATALVDEMPCTFDALAAGRITEWTATCLVRETAVLQAHDRAEVDAGLDRMLRAAGTSQGRLVRAAKALAQGLDAAAAVARSSRAVADRRVTIRPAPDTMVLVSALLPVTEGVATFAALRRAAARAAATGDPRGRGQVMADTLVARVTGRDPVDDPVDVHVDLVITDDTLLGGGTAAATVRSRGVLPVPVPAAVARRLVAGAGAADRVWLRRLRATADGSAVVSMDSRARRFPASLARLVEVADQSCRTPWCDAPIAETDHVEAYADDGPTSRDNAQGLCRRCNLVKQALGWSAQRDPDGTVRTTTPTGHTYVSAPPPLLGCPPTLGDGPDPVVDLSHALVARHRRTA